ncbi:DUF4382 domain-containing protein [Aggregicoccus sp. 17bor-14]|nr:DUF4382 domain-containing protein [Simulacricoccus sp. 17bor-14]MRI91223.1 DUF4382 domain-containing protein [Aggregicoccus sp. 17bor-14]
MRTAKFLTSTLLALALTACGGEQKVTVKLTDAPGDTFEKAVVTISKVYLKGSVEGSASDNAKDEDKGSKGDVVLLDTPVTTDLLTLANDTADLVKDARVPTGTYKELRFVITGAYVQVKEDGASRIYASSADYAGLPAGAHVDGPLQLPSLATSGLKVKFDKDADVSVTSEGDQQVILVDFNVAQSFGHAAGVDKKWVMHPVIKGADLQLSGNVKVTVTPAQGVVLSQAGALEAVLVSVDADTGAETREPLALSAGTDGTWSADFKYLLPGSYQVDLQAAAGATFSTTPGHPTSATVGSGAQADVAFTLTSFELPAL